jgi:hypothetical protein
VIEVVPASVGTTAQAWDEQHLDLQAAAGQVGGAGSGGFTSAVSGTAARFLTSWERHVRGLGDTAEDRADGLRTAINDFLATDQVVYDDFVRLAPHTVEER